MITKILCKECVWLDFYFIFGVPAETMRCEHESCYAETINPFDGNLKKVRVDDYYRKNEELDCRHFEPGSYFARKE